MATFKHSPNHNYASDVEDSLFLIVHNNNRCSSNPRIIWHFTFLVKFQVFQREYFGSFFFWWFCKIQSNTNELKLNKSKTFINFESDFLSHWCSWYWPKVYIYWNWIDKHSDELGFSWRYDHWDAASIFGDLSFKNIIRLLFHVSCQK